MIAIRHWDDACNDIDLLSLIKWYVVDEEKKAICSLEFVSIRHSRRQVPTKYNNVRKIKWWKVGKRRWILFTSNVRYYVNQWRYEFRTTDAIVYNNYLSTELYQRRYNILCKGGKNNYRDLNASFGEKRWCIFWLSVIFVNDKIIKYLKMSNLSTRLSKSRISYWTDITDEPKIDCNNIIYYNQATRVVMLKHV